MGSPHAVAPLCLLGQTRTARHVPTGLRADAARYLPLLCRVDVATPGRCGRRAVPPTPRNTGFIGDQRADAGGQTAWAPPIPRVPPAIQTFPAGSARPLIQSPSTGRSCTSLPTCSRTPIQGRLPTTFHAAARPALLIKQCLRLATHSLVSADVACLAAWTRAASTTVHAATTCHAMPTARPMDMPNSGRIKRTVTNTVNRAGPEDVRHSVRVRAGSLDALPTATCLHYTPRTSCTTLPSILPLPTHCAHTPACPLTLPHAPHHAFYLVVPYRVCLRHRRRRTLRTHATLPVCYAVLHLLALTATAPSARCIWRLKPLPNWHMVRVSLIQPSTLPLLYVPSPSIQVSQLLLLFSPLTPPGVNTARAHRLAPPFYDLMVVNSP